MNQDLMRARTKRFAHGCVRTAARLSVDPLRTHIRGQLIRCATSVAANYRAACLAQSKAGFSAKISIVLEEADESIFWIEFAIDETILAGETTHSLLQEAKELAAIFFATRRTARSKQ
jgi:four helix bundle protein